MSKDLQKFIPFAKVDSTKQEVWGLVTAEVPDKTGETCLYAKTKPYYQSWSDEFQKATDGKSYGNLRYMHQLRVVGKGIGIEFRDTDKEIWMGFKVTDAGVWTDIEEGVLTGFSQGGKYVEGPNRKGEYVSSPTEVSVVDNPCLGSAHFSYIKADGSVEMRKVRSTPLVSTPVDTPPFVKTEQASGFTLPAITIDQAVRAARGEDPQLTPEQIAGFETLKAFIAKSPSLQPTDEETPEVAKGACSCNCDACANCSKCEMAAKTLTSETPEITEPVVPAAPTGEVTKAHTDSPAGTPAESDTKMENTQGTDLKDHVLALKTAVDAFAKAFEAAPAPAAVVPAPVAPAPVVPVADVNKAAEGDLMKSVETKVDSMLKGFLGELKEVFGVLETPKAAANANGKVVTKAADTAAPAEVEEEIGEPIFKAQGAPAGVAMTPELRKAFKDLRGVPLGSE